MFFGKKVTGPAEWLLVCLGNYGKQYENTRHNIGFMAAERLIDKQGLRCNRLRFRALTELIEFGGARVLLMMPQTYMNLSGEAVGEAARFYKIPSDHVLVIYDDVSLPLGKLRIRDKGSAGGHNGIKNIIAHLGTDVFPRVKVGAALRQETKRPLAVLCADEQEARRMAADLTALTGEECVTLFAREWQLRDRVSASHSFEQERLDALCRMAFGRTGIVVATVDGMMQRTLPPTALRDAVLTLRLGEEHDLHALAERLTAAGYVRCEQVEGAGQFAVRGGILDV